MAEFCIKCFKYALSFAIKKFQFSKLGRRMDFEKYDIKKGKEILKNMI